MSEDYRSRTGHDFSNGYFENFEDMFSGFGRAHHEVGLESYKLATRLCRRYSRLNVYWRDQQATL